MSEETIKVCTPRCHVCFNFETYCECTGGKTESSEVTRPSGLILPESFVRKDTVPGYL